MSKIKSMKNLALFAVVVMLLGMCSFIKADAKTLEGTYSKLSIGGEYNSATATIYNKNTSVRRYVWVICQAYTASGGYIDSDNVDGIIKSGARTAILVGLKNVGAVYGSGTIYNGTSSSAGALETLSDTVYLTRAAYRELSPKLNAVHTVF